MRMTCLMVTEVWKYLVIWWKNISGIKMKISSVLNACIICDVPSDSVLLKLSYAKYYIINNTYIITPS